MKRPLLVFAGQSNMMGAATLPPRKQIFFARSYEYLHKPRRFGAPCGIFKQYGFPVGEFSYRDLNAAYGQTADPAVKSTLTQYGVNAYFAPSIANFVSAQPILTAPFATYCEANAPVGVSLPPFLVALLEDAGYACAYTHAAQGGAPISHFLTGGAAAYFDEKVRDFFADSEAKFPSDDTSLRVFLWHQGESDGARGFDDYYADLCSLRARVLRLGFTHFCILRVGIWGDTRISEIMRAQEALCRNFPDCHMLTRAASFIPWGDENLGPWFAVPPTEEYRDCRDSCFGYENRHINEKGFRLMAAHAAPNLIRVLFEDKEPILEEENIIALLAPRVS